MPSSTPDWSALASQHERLVDKQVDEGPSGSDPAVQDQPGQPGRSHAAAGSVHQPRWRYRALGSAAAATAAVLAVGAAGTASASAAPVVTRTAASSPSWHIVKQVHAGDAGGFTAVTTFGATGGWAFSGQSRPTAWRRSGSSWTQVSFPGKAGESVVAAGASSATNVWAFTGGAGPARALRWNGRGWTAERSFAKQIGGAVVLSRDDVWVFGEPYYPLSGLGAWHFNGHSWTHVKSGPGLEGGSGLAADDVWAFGGTDVAHWNGHSWYRKSLASLLPARNKHGLNNPSVEAIYAQSADSVWAIGNGDDEDDGGPMVVLHYDGHGWSKAASRIAGGYNSLGQVAPDGQDGLWIPLLGGDGGPSYLLHYSGGHLTTAKLPAESSKIEVTGIAAIRGTRQALAAGFTHAYGNLGAHVVAVILQYKS